MKTIKNTVSIVLSIIILICAMVISPISTNAASSYTIPLNGSLLSAVGKQTPYKYACSCYAAAYANTIVDKQTHYFSEYNRYGESQDNVDCIWYGMTAGQCSNAKALYKYCYDRINERRPTVIYVTSSESSQHWITVVGYTGVTDPNNMTISNLLVIDPLDGYTGSAKVYTKYSGKSPYYYRYTNKQADGSDPVPPTPSITPTQCVSDGDYHIVSALNESYGLNVANNSTAATANVQLWNNMDTANLTSLISVKHTGSGYYTMTFKNSGKNLDVYNANKTSGTNVWQYDSNGNDAQKWIIVPSGDCYFYIIPKINTNLALDVSGGNAVGAANIQVYTQNQTKAQKWKFLASGKPTEASVTNSLKDGEYTISTALSSYSGINIYGGLTDNGVNVQLWNNMGLNTVNTNVKVKHLGDGIFSLIFKKSNKAIESIYSNISGANVQQYSFTNSNNQKWIIKPAGNGYYYIINRLSGLAMDVYNGSTSNGTNIHAHLLNWSNAQKWKFNPVKKRITYNANGGKLYNDTVTNHKVDGLNTSRLDSQVIVYTRIFGAKTTTNQYGDEYSFDKNGKKVGSRLYNNTTGLDIPAGGFVISKHANSSFDLYNICKKAAYAYPDFETGYVSFYNNEHDFKAGAKLVTLNNTYGTLATPTRDGYTFDGWYTGASGGTKITSSSVFTGTTILYAHWSKQPEPTTVTESTTERTTSTNPIQSNIRGDVDGDSAFDVRDATAIKQYAAEMIELTSEQLKIADITKDKVVDVRDATAIQQIIAELADFAYFDK